MGPGLLYGRAPNALLPFTILRARPLSKDDPLLRPPGVNSAFTTEITGFVKGGVTGMTLTRRKDKWVKHCLPTYRKACGEALGC